MSALNDNGPFRTPTPPQKARGPLRLPPDTWKAVAAFSATGALGFADAWLAGLRFIACACLVVSIIGTVFFGISSVIDRPTGDPRLRLDSERATYALGQRIFTACTTSLAFWIPATTWLFSATWPMYIASIFGGVLVLSLAHGFRISLPSEPKKKDP